MFAIIAILILVLCVILAVKNPRIALVILPVVCFLVGYAAVLRELFENIIFVPLIFVVTLLAVLMTRREPESESWPQKCAKWILIILAFLLLFVTAGLTFGPLSIFGFVFFILFVGSIIAYGLTSRHATAAYVVSTIGSSMRQNLPLPMALESAAGGRTDNRSRILRRIQKWLVQGYSLSESIKRGYPKCPGYVVAMTAAAERIDQLPLAIKSIEADIVNKADESRKIRPVPAFYPVILIVFAFFIVLGVVTKVIPVFEAVLTETTEAAQLPASTRFLIRITNFIAYDYGWLIIFLFALVVLVVVPASIRIKFRPRRPDKPYLTSRIVDFIKWHSPVLHWFEKNYSMVQVVELLRLSLNADGTVNNAIANTLGLDVNNCFRKRLKKWLQKVERGDNIATAARQAGLGSPLAWAFDEKVNQSNTLTVLETLESLYRSNYSYYANLVRFIMWPCIILIMGAMIGFVVYAIFSPLVAIIHHTADLVIP
ncbi:MAG: type II secretion system F family protein [Phycisphaerae bacterium]|nr:type II secretion system F family protein [Phycisphaerae bacterium]